MQTWLKSTHSIENQKLAIFTGEGAYHGSTKPKPANSAERTIREPVPEARPSTLERYVREGATEIRSFEAHFPNRFKIVDQLGIPDQETIRTDGVTFCWCPFKEAQREAGPLTKNVLNRMERHLTGRKRFIYIDSKIQYFEPGDLPVDSELWHVDGSIAIKDERVQRLGASILHDMRARVEGSDLPTYLACQSSDHCATGLLDQPLRLTLPELIPNFHGFDVAVRAEPITEILHPPGAIVAYDGLSMHRAKRAIRRGWRLWLRCTETDVEIHPSVSIIECYGTVFRPIR